MAHTSNKERTQTRPVPGQKQALLVPQDDCEGPLQVVDDRRPVLLVEPLKRVGRRIACVTTDGGSGRKNDPERASAPSVRAAWSMVADSGSAHGVGSSGPRKGGRSSSTGAW